MIMVLDRRLAQVCLRWAWQMGVATVTKTEKVPAVILEVYL